MSSKLKDKDSTIHGLQQRIHGFQEVDKMQKSVEEVRKEEGQRVESLTKTLLEKQTLVESLMAEKSTLQLQVERLEVSVLPFMS